MMFMTIPPFFGFYLNMIANIQFFFTDNDFNYF